MNTTIYNKVKEYFSKLSPEGTHEYEKKIFKYSELCANPEYVEVFQYMISSDDEWGYEAFTFYVVIIEETKTTYL